GDGVVACGEGSRGSLSGGLGVGRGGTFHEAADVEQFHPLRRKKLIDAVWIGNWGDEERTAELQEFLIGPAGTMPDVRVVAHGVRYPAIAIKQLNDANVEYRGYLPNLFSPQVYSESFVALHIPRRQYTNGLAGIPTIRVFEALACGVPLVCSPWTDEENLFRPGQDYLLVNNGQEMAAELRHLLRDAKARHQLAECGLQTIRQRHTCAHRAQELLSICEEIAA